MQDAKAILITMEVKNKPKKAREEYIASLTIINEYQSLIGGLMWLAI